MAEGQTTKAALAAALKELTIQKGFDKVSVGDITGACGLGRQSFYYHFQDKFQLLEWVFREGAFLTMCTDVTLENWPMRMRKMLDVMEEERRFYISVVKAQPEFFSLCLCNVMEPLFYQLAGYIARDSDITEERCRFGSIFYALGCSAMITRWAKNGMRCSAASLAKNIYLLAKDSEWAASRLSDDPKAKH